MGISGIGSTQRNRDTVTLERVIPEPRDQWVVVPRRVNNVWHERDRASVVFAGMRPAVTIGLAVVGAFGMGYTLGRTGEVEDAIRVGVIAGVVSPTVIGFTSLIKGMVDYYANGS
ncbi:MAG: hypothetical protein OXF02_02280 [Simkaniaceae bacterium]|nr:hypothetical protein [Simkaniaceae bacterium]